MSHAARSVIRPAFIVSHVLFVLLCFGPRVGAETVVARMAAVPQTIQIAPELQPHVEAMLHSSRTFRQQFERIVGASNLILIARVDVSCADRTFRARSTIRRYDSGLLVVTVSVGPGGHQAEWIAHEFEHVLEQLDGILLVSLASRGQAGIWYSGSDMVETDRAVRAGRMVLQEMSGRKHSQTGLWSR